MIERLFPTGVVSCEGRLGDFQGRLYPEERWALRRATGKRLREFTGGRTCARIALRRLGLKESALPVNADRTPEWPPGVVGSITHTDTYCAVAAGQQNEWLSLGIDVERVADVEPGYWAYFCTPRETAWLYGMNRDVAQRFGGLLFSAKECFYKCQYGISGKSLAFHDVELQVDTKMDQFDVRLRLALPTLRMHGAFRGRFVFSNGYVATGMAIPLKAEHAERAL